MKQCILRRALSALLCLVLALSLTACSGETERPETPGGRGRQHGGGAFRQQGQCV